uniref:Uncharacterized protein n=1 Tax=Cacopsylla melanoneura TaxID=428564 RepID=A0A8D8U0G3_9HEMI
MSTVRCHRNLPAHFIGSVPRIVSYVRHILSGEVRDHNVPREPVHVGRQTGFVHHQLSESQNYEGQAEAQGGRHDGHRVRGGAPTRTVQCGQLPGRLLDSRHIPTVSPVQDQRSTQCGSTAHPDCAQVGHCTAAQSQT